MAADHHGVIQLDSVPASTQRSAEEALQALQLSPGTASGLPQNNSAVRNPAPEAAPAMAPSAASQQQASASVADSLHSQQPQEGAAGFQQRFFSEEALDVTVHISITNLGRQLLVWVGSDQSPPNLSNLAMGILTPARQSHLTPSARSAHSQQQLDPPALTNTAPVANGHLRQDMQSEGLRSQQQQPQPSEQGGQQNTRSAVASTLVRGTGEEASVALALKLTKRLGVPVLLSWTLPASNPLLNAWAEKRLVEILCS